MMVLSLLLALLLQGAAPADSLEKLTRRLESDNPGDRAGALSELVSRWESWTAGDLEKLARAARSGDLEIAQRADEAFSRIRIRRELGGELVRRAPDLDEALYRRRPEDLVRALKQFASALRSGGVAPAATNAVLARVGTPTLDETALIEAAKDAAEGRLRELAPFFAPYLEDPRASVREAALRTLGWLGAREYAPQIAARLAVDPAALPALGLLGVGDYRDQFLKRLQDPDVRFAGAAVSALALLGDRRVVPELVRLLSDSKSNVRILAAAALADLGGASEIAPVAALIEDPEDSVRATAIAALLSLPAPERSWQRIRPLLRDPSERVRKIAAVYVGKALPESEVGERRPLAAELQALFPKPGVEAWSALIHLRVVPPRSLKEFLAWVQREPSLSTVDRRMLVDALARTLEPRTYAKLSRPIEVSTPIEGLEDARLAFLQAGLDLEGPRSFGGRVNAGRRTDASTLLQERFLSSTLFVLHRDRVVVLPWEDCLKEWIKKLDRP
jgi:HEAT repeat protein